MANSAPKSWLPRPGFVFVLLVIFIGSIFFSRFIDWWPPLSIERRSQREQLAERVQAVGGWDAIRRDCISFAEQHTNDICLPYSRSRDSDLPPAILALRPLTIQYAPQYGCVRMRIFGAHSVGSHSRPYFGLEVDTSTNSASYKHGTGYDNGNVMGNHHSVAEQVAEGIYELY
jgi:hypothetical protein